MNDQPLKISMGHASYRKDGAAVEVVNGDILSALRKLNRQNRQARVDTTLKLRKQHPSPRARRRAKRLRASKKAANGGRP